MPCMVGGTALGMRRGMLLLTGALFLSACSGTASETNTTVAPTATTATTTSTTPPTTTTISTTTTLAPTTVGPMTRPEVLVSNVNRTSIDDFDTTGDDLYRVMMELTDLFVFLEGNPTGTAEDMVSLMFEPSYPVWNPILVGFRELTDNPGWHYVDKGVETLGVELVNTTDDSAVLRVADQRTEQAIASADATVVKTYTGWDRKVTTITLARGADGRWRYSDLLPSVPISDTDLAEMVPVEWTGRMP